MKIVIAMAYPNWDAIYVDGILKKDDDNLYACDLAEVLKNNLPCYIENIETKSVDEDWWEDKDYENGGDGYPEKIEDVVFEER